jgi:hypothetical protein
MVAEPSDVEVQLIDRNLDLTFYGELKAFCRGATKQRFKEVFKEAAHDEL